jgi:hypothetical protein
VGTADGCRLGKTDGVGDGGVEGCAEGACVGSREGHNVESHAVLVGARLGTGDGDLVGK